LVLGTLEAMVRAVVASWGREDRIIDEERFSGILEGDSDGIVSVIDGASVSVAALDGRRVDRTGRRNGKGSVDQFGAEFGRRSAKSSSSDGKHSDCEMMENTGNEGYLLSTQRVVL